MSRPNEAVDNGVLGKIQQVAPRLGAFLQNVFYADEPAAQRQEQYRQLNEERGSQTSTPPQRQSNSNYNMVQRENGDWVDISRPSKSVVQPSQPNPTLMDQPTLPPPATAVVDIDTIIANGRDLKVYFTPQDRPLFFDDSSIDQSVFDYKITDFKSVMASDQKKINTQNAKLQRKAPPKKREYDRVLIRIRFPSQVSLTVQGTFKPSETMQDVQTWVVSLLRDEKVPFYLYTAPPFRRFHQSVDMKKSLSKLGLVPAAIVYISVDKRQTMFHHVLHVKTHLAQRAVPIQRDYVPKSLSPCPSKSSETGPEVVRKDTRASKPPSKQQTTSSSNTRTQSSKGPTMRGTSSNRSSSHATTLTTEQETKQGNLNANFDTVSFSGPLSNYYSDDQQLPVAHQQTQERHSSGTHVNGVNTTTNHVVLPAIHTQSPLQVQQPQQIILPLCMFNHRKLIIRVIH